MKDKIDSFIEEYRFLSNFWPVTIRYEDIIYPSVEHAYQAQKTDHEGVRQEIANLETAGKAKRFGEDLKLLCQIRSDWSDELRILHMTALVEIKFSLSNPELAQQLIATGDAELIEGNNWDDTFFGVCDGQGENHLGKILMSTRQKLNDSIQTMKNALDENKGRRRKAANQLGISERTLYRYIKTFGLE